MGFEPDWIEMHKMKRYRVLAALLLVFCLCSFSAAHKFYVSVTNVGYSEEEASLQIISRIFIDDLEAALKARYEIDAALATPAELQEADRYIERYFNAKFTVYINGAPREYTFLGKRYDKDLIVCYIEVGGLERETLESVGIQNEILTELFDEQKNLVHFKVLGKKKSFVLVRENNKGMLNL